MRSLFAALFAFFTLQADTVQIITTFSLQSPYPIEFKELRGAGHTVLINQIPGLDALDCFENSDSIKSASALSDNQDLKKILLMNPCAVNPAQVTKEKLVVFIWEPMVLDPSYYNYFSKVYTWDDSLIDNQKFFKFFYPCLQPMIAEIPSFKEKKFCTTVAQNWTPERIKMVLFFNSKPKGDFEFYGRGPPAITMDRAYRGPLPGGHSQQGKIEGIKNYKFYLCFENTIGLKGYISEKIFDCFAAGCVPVYWGASNVQEFIPKGCFIDYRNFKSNEELYSFLKKMTQEEYDGYITRIRAYLNSREAQLFSIAHFDQTLRKAAQ